MDKKKPLFFFRNDDVRNSLDSSLIKLTELFINHGVPLSHAVEPGNITKEVAAWLNSLKKAYPDLIEIIQHGYNHNLSNPSIKMEFGGNRRYNDQLQDITKGKDIMDQYFGELWTPVFTFPYGTYNHTTLQAINDSGYKAISSKIQFSTLSRIKNLFGQTLKKDMILGKKISYHPEVRQNYNFKEISVSVNLIKKYTDECNADHYSLEEIKKQVDIATRNTSVIGVLFHHRFHAQHMGLIEKIIIYLKNQGVPFSSISNIIRFNQ